MKRGELWGVVMWIVVALLGAVMFLWVLVRFPLA